MKKYREVAALILRRDDQFLLVRKPRQNHAWQFPQGGVDPGETLSQAAVRELAEECGADLQIDNLSDNSVTYYQYDFPADFLRHHGEFVGARVSFFLASYVSGEVAVDGKEIVEARWCTRQEIVELVAGEYWEIVREVL